MGTIIVCLGIVVVGYGAGIIPILGPLILGLAVEDFNARLRQKAEQRSGSILQQKAVQRLGTMLRALNAEMAVTGLLISGHYFFDFEMTLWQVGLFITAYAIFRFLRFERRQEEKRLGIKW